MKKTKDNKRTLGEDWALIWRGVKIWHKVMPGYWFYEILCILVETVSPYYDLYLSAQLVNELANGADPTHLLILAAFTVCGGFLLSTLRRFLQGRRKLKNMLQWYQYEGFVADAQNNFQYEHLENPDVVLKSSELWHVFNAFGGGLIRVLWAFPAMFSNILNIIFSVSLTVSMFTMTAQGAYTGLFGFINSPASALLIIGLIVINAFLAIKITSTQTIKTQEAVSELAGSNSAYRAYNRLWGADMIVFDLNRIVMEEFRKTQLRPAWVAKKEKVTIKYRSISILLDAILNIAVFLFVAVKAFIGAFSIGNFILYQGTIKRFIDAVSWFASEIGTLMHNNQYLEEFFNYLDMPNDMYKGTLAVEHRDDIDYEIEFRDVSFKYPRTDTWVLRHVNMKFKIGDKLAIVGENGSGKTTFIKLLCRLYDPTEGKILLNGIDITRYRYDEYMALFSVVFQDYTLFGFPLGENVAASCTYDEAKVRDCLIRAGLGDKLQSLENTPDAKQMNVLKLAIGWEYDSEGVDFSGGEKQKIALARALYKDAPFVILDEPTAALDPIAEAAVYENFNVLVKDKTAVFISHRLSSCRFCDMIAVFDNGGIAQIGSHDELVSDESGKYHALWNAQAQYYAS